MLAAFLWSFPPYAVAEDSVTTLENKIAKKIADSGYNNFFTLAYENDLIGGGTDQNYTNGLRLSYFDLNAKFPEIAHEIADHVPTFSINKTSSIFYSIGQNLYTPDDIESPVQDPDDRPWAAFLYGSMGMATLTDNHIDELEATLGVVGPAALGEQVQKAVHKHITDSPEPQGWDNQLKNEPGLILSWQRRWPGVFHLEEAGMAVVAEPYAGASLGNIYTYANTGMSFRFGPQSSSLSDTPLRVRPALPGTGFFEIPKDGWGWYLFGGLEARAVGRNIFLDGNSFYGSQSVDKKFLVGDANAGIALTIGRTQINYTLVYRTKEFETQDATEVFGSLSLTRRF